MPEKKETSQTKFNKDAFAAYNKAIKVFRKGDYTKALAALKAFLKEYPAEMEITERANIYLDICKARLKKEEISLKTFSDCYQYGVFKMNEGDFEEALSALEKARRKKPKEGKVPFLIANIYCLMEDEENCLEYLKKAVKIDKYFGILAQNESDFVPLEENKKFNLITKTKDEQDKNG